MSYGGADTEPVLRVFVWLVSFSFSWWEWRDSNSQCPKAPALQAGVDTRSTSLPNAKKPPRGVSLGGFGVDFLWFYGEATLVSGSFARAWVGYFGDSRTTLVPRHDAKIPLSHERVLVPMGDCV